MARVAVAATAPFGADVLERLAARHDVAVLLTRPDAPKGRGRALAPPPAKVAAERLDVPVVQPERPEPGLDLDAPLFRLDTSETPDLGPILALARD